MIKHEDVEEGDFQIKFVQSDKVDQYEPQIGALEDLSEQEEYDDDEPDEEQEVEHNSPQIHLTR